MKGFTDNNGRTWSVAVNVDAIKRVRGLLEVDLLEITSGKLIDKLIGDPVLLCDIVYVLCKPQADQTGISDEQFGQAMAGDAIEHATRALLEELVDFCPSPRDRANLQKVLTTTWNLMERARDLIEARLTDDQLEKLAEAALQEVTQNDAENSSGSVPESSASIPDR